MPVNVTFVLSGGTIFPMVSIPAKSHHVTPVTHRERTWHWLILGATAIVLYSLFHFVVFTNDDQIRYVIGSKQWATYGTEPFNFEMSFAYYWMLQPLIRWIPTAMVPTVLNGMGAVAGTLALLPLYELFRSLAGGRPAFFATLFFLLSPAYWTITRYGHPVILALFFFFCALVVFDRAIAAHTSQLKSGVPTRRVAVYVVLAILLALAALVLRGDLLLVSLAPLGLLIYRRPGRRWFVGIGGIFYGALLAGYALLRWISLGYLLNPGGGTLRQHLAERGGDVAAVIGHVAKNAALLIFSLLPLIAAAIAIAIVWLVIRRQWRLLAFFGLWSVPTLLAFLPFGGMDYIRLTIPALPPLFLALAIWIDTVTAARFRVVAPLLLLIVAHLSPGLTRPLLTSVYPFKATFDGQPVTSIPLEPLTLGFRIDRDFYTAQHSLARTVTGDGEPPVVIAATSSQTPWYLYELIVRQDADCRLTSLQGPRDVRLCTIGRETFYTVDVDTKAGQRALDQMARDPAWADTRFHVNPFISGVPPAGPLRSQAELAQLLDDPESFLINFR